LRATPITPAVWAKIIRETGIRRRGEDFGLVIDSRRLYGFSQDLVLAGSANETIKLRR
jgi:hypothetical protein